MAINAEKVIAVVKASSAATSRKEISAQWKDSKTKQAVSEGRLLTACFCIDL